MNDLDSKLSGLFKQQRKVVPLFDGKRAAQEPVHRTITLLTPLNCEHGIFPTITRKVLKLHDTALKAARWPPSLRFDGAPFGSADIVWRVCGRYWTATLPAWARDLEGSENEPIRAKVDRILV
jgi:hypothetical protein